MEYIPTSPRTTPTTEQLIKAGRSESSIFVTIVNTDCLWLNSNAHISVVTARHIALWIAYWIVNQHEIKYIVYCIINNCPSINEKWFNDQLFKHEDCAEANSYFHSFIWLIVCLYNVKKTKFSSQFPRSQSGIFWMLNMSSRQSRIQRLFIYFHIWQSKADSK